MPRVSSRLGRLETLAEAERPPCPRSAIAAVWERHIAQLLPS